MAKDALDFLSVEGIQTNIPFLSTIFEDKDFIDGNIHTGFIDENILMVFQRC